MPKNLILTIALIFALVANAFSQDLSYNSKISALGFSKITEDSSFNSVRNNFQSSKFKTVATYGTQSHIVEFQYKEKANSHQVIIDSTIYKEGWHELPQVIFWKNIVSLKPDTSIFSSASSRVIMGGCNSKDWGKCEDSFKTNHRDSLRFAYCIPDSTRIFTTHGRSDFYQFDKVLPDLIKGINAFIKNGVDPFYAQSILLIESPGRLQKSTAGAYGPFQLMKGVAKSYGLRVDSKVDERKDFDRAAYAASQLIDRVCVPYAKRMLNNRNIAFSEDELWFKLLVLHIYHAGAGNVSAVLDVFQPTEGGITFIKALWSNEAAGFRNASQNYAQIALATHLQLHDLILSNSVSFNFIETTPKRIVLSQSK